MIIFRVAFLVLIILFSSNVYADDNSWLLGEWEMAYDPDGDTKDILSFSEGGEFRTTEASTGRQVKGRYVVKSDVINLSLISKGKIFMKLKLTYTDKRDKLFYNPEKTDDPAYYTKLKK